MYIVYTYPALPSTFFVVNGILKNVVRPELPDNLQGIFPKLSKIAFLNGQALPSCLLFWWFSQLVLLTHVRIRTVACNRLRQFSKEQLQTTKDSLTGQMHGSISTNKSMNPHFQWRGCWAVRSLLHQQRCWLVSTHLSEINMKATQWMPSRTTDLIRTQNDDIKQIQT